MYAIVDIETTGGHAAAHGITEVAVAVHDGTRIVHEYATLVNPGVPIPVYIRALTGITDEMVKSAPSFAGIAEELFSLLHDKIFVAHNVNFDYSFLRHHFAAAGYQLQCKKLCTVRLSRKIFPGFGSYSLGKLCARLGVVHQNRHRAMGDVQATSCLFTMLLEHDKDGHIMQSLNRRSKEQQLPPNLKKADIDRLPASPGVYYFKDSKDKVVYTGKAVNIRKRVCSHFSGHNAGRQRQEFLKNICSVAYTPCATELMAFILEAVEIKRLWPVYNRAMKHFEQAWGLYRYEDQKGYFRLMLDRRGRHSSPLCTFGRLTEGHNRLVRMAKDFGLCPKLCFIQRNQEPCTGIAAGHCHGACMGGEDVSGYNERVLKATESLKQELPSFMLVDDGRHSLEKSVIVMQEGRVVAIGYIPADYTIRDVNAVKSMLEPCLSNDYIQNLVLDYAAKNGGKVIFISNISTGLQLV